MDRQSADTRQTREFKLNKIRIADHLPEALSVPEVANLAFAGRIASRKVIDKDDFTLSLWRHELAPGATITLDAPAQDHTFYVVEGEMTVGGTPVPPKGAASVGARAKTVIGAGAEGATVLHYVGHAESRPDKPGGCVHILSQPWLERSPVSSHALYFDSSCPNCSVWLHMTQGQKGSGAKPHYHTEDEIICVVEGEMNLGTRDVATGGAVGIAKEVVYSFNRGEGGLAFINFRQADPFFLPKGKKVEEAESERILMRAHLQRLRDETVRAGAQPAPA